MSRQLVLAALLIGVCLSTKCWYDARQGNMTSHTKDKHKVPCSGCKYCLKVTLTDGDTYSYWDCGCGDQNVVGLTCLKTGSQSGSAYDPSTGHLVTANYYCCSGDTCNSAQQISYIFVIVSTIFAVYLRNHF